SFHETLHENALAEYFGREIAYFPFRVGMIIPCRQKNFDKPCYLEVKKSFFAEGFAFLILEKIFQRDEIFILFQGTDLANSESIRQNFADVSGLYIFKEYAKKIFEDNLCQVLLDNPKAKVKINIHGHSQGAAHAQHFCNELAKGLVSTQNEYNSTWQKIQKI